MCSGSGHATSAKYLGFYIMFSSHQFQDCPLSNIKVIGPELQMIWVHLKTLCLFHEMPNTAVKHAETVEIFCPQTLQWTPRVLWYFTEKKQIPITSQ